MPLSEDGAFDGRETGWSVHLPTQHLETKTRSYGDKIAQSKTVDGDNVVILFPKTPLSLLQSDVRSVNQRQAAPWPNPACKAWQPSPDYYNPPLYTPAQRAIRDTSPWTMVQAILAPLQFLVFAISLGLVGRYLATGQGYEIATFSIVAKTIILYVIMITGSIWEKVVFDEWLFADAFFWEDVFSMLVLGLQTLYLGALIFGWWDPKTQVLIALGAYVTYVINAAQFVWKLRMARLQGAKTPPVLEVAA
jgi:3-vinyl bacteriochlorophyllide hydratase